MTDVELVSGILRAYGKGETYRSRDEIKSLALSDYLGDYIGDFDLNAIIDDAYLLIDTASGPVWVANPAIDEDAFADIVKLHDERESLMTNIKTISDAEIIDHNAKLRTPCMTENGECCIVTKLRIFQDSETLEVMDATDAAVFATEREAEECAARFFRGDADSVIKHTYTIRVHHVAL